MAQLLLGRRRELDEAASFLDAVPHGPAALVLAGEAGIGKTALWQAIAARAVGHGYRVLSTRPAEPEAQLSFAGLADLLGAVEPEALSALPAPQRRALDVALLRSHPGERPLDRRAVSTAAVSLLTGLARATPVVVAIDDLQWLDRPTAHVLEFAVRRLGSGRIGLLAALRAEASAPAPLGLADALPAERLTRLALGPLDTGSLHRLLLERLGSAPQRPMLRRIERASRGNPFLTLEIARALDHAPADTEAELPVPDEVRKLVDRRIAGLPAATREALLAAAALSRPTTGIVAARPLRRAEEAQVVQIAPGGGISFAHPLFASAVYAAAPATRRRAVHRRLAARVADPEERARHLALGSEGPDSGVAAALEEAGRLARSRGAPEAAAELLERARALTPAAGLDDLHRRSLRAADHHFHAGDRARARELLEDVLARAGRGPQRAEALRLLGQARYHDDDLVDAIALFRQALEEPGDDPALAAPVELQLAFCHVVGGDLAAADRHAQAGLAHAEEVADDGLVAEALAVATMVDFALGRDPGDEPIARALRLEDGSRDLLVQMRPSMIAGVFFLWTGRLPRGAALLYALRERILERGEEADLPLGTMHLAWLECLRGDLAAAGRLADEALEVAAQVGGATTRATALFPRTLVDAYRGDAAGARAAAAEALATFERAGWTMAIAWLLHALGFLALSLGDAREVHRLLGDAAGYVEASGTAEPMVYPFLPDEIEALVALGEVDRAEALTEAFHERARALDRPWAIATSGRCRGLVGAARGDLAGARAALEQAVEDHGRVEMPFELARTLLVLGRVQRRSRRKGDARESLTRALALFEEIGTPLWAEKARAELARVAPRPGGKLELTPTERRVAELAASGLTNREIAAELLLSRRTVEVNLARSYRKLGIRSRAQLGSRLAAEPS